MKFAIKILLFCLFITLSHNGAYAISEIDSLKSLIPNANEALKTKLFNDLAYKYRIIDPNQTIIFGKMALKLSNNNSLLKSKQNALSCIALGYRYIGKLDSALYYQNLALDIAITMNDENLQSLEYNRMGLIYKDKGELNKSLDFYFKSIEIIEKGDSKQKLANSYNNIGNIYRRKGFFDIALQYYVKTLKIRKEIDDKEGLAYIFNNIGNLYADINHPASSIQYHKKALKLKKELNDDIGIVISYINIGEVFLLESYQNPDSSLYYFQLALSTVDNLGLHNKKINIYNDIGKVYLSINNPIQSLEYFRRALELNKSTSDINKLNTYKHLGTAYNKLNKPDSAIHYLNMAYKIARNENILTKVADIYYKLSESYLINKNFEEALKYHKKYTAVKDSIFGEKVNQNITELLINYEVEEQEKTNQILQQKNQIQKLEIKEKTLLLYFIIITAMLILGIAIIIYYGYRGKKKANSILEKQNTIIQESERGLREANATKDKFFSIIAHDLVNPFNAILGFTNMLIEDFDQLDNNEKLLFLKNIKDASNTTSKLLKNLLDWSRAKLNKLEFEPRVFKLADLVNENIDLLNKTIINKIVDITSSISSHTKVWADRQMIDAVIRNLLTNAVKFSFSNQQISISAREINEYIEVCIIDKGIGMTKSELKTLFNIDKQSIKRGTSGEKGTGLGLILSKEFIEKNKGKIWAEGLPGKGTKIFFTIPKKQNSQ